MARPASLGSMTYAEYLAREEAGTERHEFINGEVFAMAGGTPEHSALALAVGAELRAALRGRPCRVFSSDLRIYIPETGSSTYPDGSVVCGPLEHPPNERHAVTNPVVLVEVLSDTTEAYDRGAKAAHYRRLGSLREYVLVSQHEAHIEVYRRNDDGSWGLREARAREAIELASLDVILRVDDVYQGLFTG